MSRIALRLDLGERELLHQVGASGFGRPRGADRGDHLVDVIERDLETFEDVGAARGSLQLELGAPGDDFLAVGDVLLQRPLAGSATRGCVPRSTSASMLTPNVCLQCGVLEEIVEHLHRLRVALQLDDGAHPGAVRFVAQVADAVELAFFDQLGDALEQGGLVDLVGQLGDDDLIAVAAGRFLDERLGADHDAAATGGDRRRLIPSRPRIVPPVGKSGPVTISISSSMVASGLSIRRTIASQISLRLCGGILVAMPTAMPALPLSSRFGKRAGKHLRLLQSRHRSWA